MFALLGVASNCASKAPVCEGIVLFCQVPGLVKQLASTCVRTRKGDWGAVRSVRSHASAKATQAASDAFIRASRLDSLNVNGMLGCSFHQKRGRQLRPPGRSLAARTVTVFSRRRRGCGPQYS